MNAGVDIVFRTNRDGLIEYDFIVAPGASPSVGFEITGAEEVHLADDDSLEIKMPEGILRQLRPNVFQMVGDRRVRVEGRYSVHDKNRVEVLVESYDRQHPLVIDPVLSFSSYFGGSDADEATAVATDAVGAIYIAGHSTSVDLPASGTLQVMNKGARDAFVAKLQPSGNAFDYVTYIGGSDSESTSGIAVSAAGEVSVTGSTLSQDFPTTVGALQRVNKGGEDAFLVKLGAMGKTLSFGTYLGGSGSDRAAGLAQNAAGESYLVGTTTSTDFPTTAGAFQPTNKGGSDGFFAIVAASGSTTAYSTLVGGTSDDEGRAVAFDTAGNGFVAGVSSSTDLTTSGPPAQATNKGFADCFVAKLPRTGGAAYLTYLGGTNTERANGLVVDSSGAAIIVGYTQSSDFPTTPGVMQPSSHGGFEAFIAKINPTGSALAYSTYFGGSQNDQASGVALDPAGGILVVGSTFSFDLPTSGGPFQSSHGGVADAFVASVSVGGDKLTYSTYLGGTGLDEAAAVTAQGMAAVVVGYTRSADFPVNGAVQGGLAQGSDSFIAKLLPGDGTHNDAGLASSDAGGEVDAGDGGGGMSGNGCACRTLPRSGSRGTGMVLLIMICIVTALLLSRRRKT